MALQKQFKRKDLKKPDPFVALSARFYSFFDKNRKKFILGLGGILLVCGAAWLFNYNRDVQEARMESLYFEMYNVWNGSGKNSPEKAISRLKIINDKIKDGKSKERANLLLADALYENKNYEESINFYEKVKDSSKEGQLTHVLSQVGLGNSFEGKKNYTKALEIYQAIIESDTDYPLFYIYYGMARCYSLDNDEKNALLILREMMSKFPAHGEIVKVETMLKKLETKT